MSERPTTRQIDGELQTTLAALGFKKGSAQTCCISLTPEISGWVGFNYAREKDGSVEAVPMLGVHCIPVHKLIAELTGERYKPCDPPTFAQNAGYLMPDRNKYIAVRFETADQIAERAQVFGNIVRDVGLPFMRQHVDIPSVLASLKRIKSVSGFEERVCAAEYLAGNIEAARTLVERYRSELQGKHAVMRGQFDKFALPFLQRLDAAVRR